MTTEKLCFSKPIKLNFQVVVATSKLSLGRLKVTSGQFPVMTKCSESLMPELASLWTVESGDQLRELGRF